MRFQKYLTSLSFILLTAVITSVTAHAQNKVVVIPLAGDAQPLQNIITVSANNGDFTNPVDAINSISDASNTNPYLIVLGPGSYPIIGQLVMKDYVSITGSGMETTELRGAVGGAGFTESAAFIVGAREADISDLSIVNSVGQNVVIGVHTSQQDMRISRTRVIVFGALNSQYGVVNQDAELKLYESEITNTGSGGTCYGIYSYSDAVLKVSDMDMSLNCNHGTQYGIYTNASSFSYVSNSIIDIDWEGVGVNNSYGYFSNGNNSKGYISDSIIGGENGAVYGGSSIGNYYITHVSNSDLRSHASGNVNCNFVRFYTGFPLDDECS
ncbi:hypothetical protein GCM10008090_30630 [Arenicella chitinivorans]|uniref:Uncharacterized protein n=1 Tax=Arenicella chitinivorans TaxID=1329800 RepID=A0A918VSI0_9GAMM|nr:hypothetical protein [Arenicella chitinivorans]GHA18865.1 hypothetical protein GCM10008090_30630 [Arenicella chitinivorans]